jgi:hypothetical protein
MNNITLNDEAYVNQAINYIPTKRFAPFYDINREKYQELQEASEPLKICKLKERLPLSEHKKIIRAIGYTQYYAQLYFPAYRFLVNEFVNEEWLALVDYHKSFHRDHIVHQPKVSWIGQVLMEQKIKSPVNQGTEKSVLEHIVDVILDWDEPGNETRYLRDYAVNLGVPEKYFNETWVENKKWKELWWYDVIKESFFLASLFHDIGYPISYINKIEKKLKTQYPVNALGHEYIKNICSRYQDRLLFYPFHNYMRMNSCNFPYDWKDKFEMLITECFSNTHSIHGALTLLYINDILRDFPGANTRPDKQFIVDLAALMIITHDLADIYMEVDKDKCLLGKTVKKKIKAPQLKIKFHRDPLSFLLLLSDLLQDFGRSSAIFNNANEYVSLEFEAKCQRVQLEFDQENLRLIITYYYNSQQETNAQKYRFIPINQLKYFSKPSGFIDYSYLFNDIQIKAELEQPQNIKV